MISRTVLRWGGYVAVAVAFAIACVFLSQWQFDRNDHRETQLRLIAANYDATPVPLEALIGPDSQFDPSDQWHPVIITGTYLAEDTLLARNRPQGGTSAFEVLVPLQTADGRIFVIDRGWVPPGKDQPEPDEIPAPPEGEVTVIARLSPGEPLPRSGRSAPEGQVPTIHLPLIAETLGAEGVMITSAFGQLVSEDPAAARPQPLPSPSEDPGPHLSYAIQWILFAIMGFVFIWYMIRTEIRHRREDAQDQAGDDRPADPVRAARHKRRRDRDMVEEDALVDAGGRG